MDVRFISTTSSQLPSLTVANGQLIYLADKDAAYYDMGDLRRPLASMRVVSALPPSSSVQENVLYAVINAEGHADASIWDASSSTYVSLSGYKATASSLGLVQPDGTTITIDSNGVISCHAEVTTLPASSITYDNSDSGLTADDAQEAIDEVYGFATTAQLTADNAVAAASTAQITADEAVAAAATAQITADEAVAAAASAQSTADDAVAAASSAQSTADDAVAAASSAQSTADDAVAAASSAQSSADAALAQIAAATTAIANILERLAAVEDVADIALTIEDTE